MAALQVTCKLEFGVNKMTRLNSFASIELPITKIIGYGFIAQGLNKLAKETRGSVIFASGVSNSLCDNQIEYDRECNLLYNQIRYCKNNNLKLVYFSSAGTIYEKSNEDKDEHSPLFPSTLYGKNKVFFESVIIHSGVEYLIIRLPNVVGFNQNKIQLFPALILQAMNEKAYIYQDAARDLIDIDDLCDILYALIKKDIKNEIIVAASGYTISVQDIFNEIQRVLGRESEITLLRGGDRQSFSTKKLNYLLSGKLKFTQDYYRHLIQKYAIAIAEDYQLAR